jgi:hypothetical protein
VASTKSDLRLCLFQVSLEHLPVHRVNLLH